jgi:hypothetical protein
MCCSLLNLNGLIVNEALNELGFACKMSRGKYVNLIMWVEANRTLRICPYIFSFHIIYKSTVHHFVSA